MPWLLCWAVATCFSFNTSGILWVSTEQQVPSLRFHFDSDTMRWWGFICNEIYSLWSSARTLRRHSRWNRERGGLFLYCVWVVSLNLWLTVSFVVVSQLWTTARVSDVMLDLQLATVWFLRFLRVSICLQKDNHSYLTFDHLISHALLCFSWLASEVNSSLTLSLNFF